MAACISPGGRTRFSLMMVRAQEEGVRTQRPRVTRRESAGRVPGREARQPSPTPAAVSTHVRLFWGRKRGAPASSCCSCGAPDPPSRTPAVRAGTGGSACVGPRGDGALRDRPARLRGVGGSFPAAPSVGRKGTSAKRRRSGLMDEGSLAGPQRLGPSAPRTGADPPGGPYLLEGLPSSLNPCPLNHYHYFLITLGEATLG